MQYIETLLLSQYMEPKFHYYWGIRAFAPAVRETHMPCPLNY